jgi:hypothetical protein
MQTVYKVYSGKAGCMCGCRGKYSYASDAVEYGSKDRGYEVRAEEVNDRSVKILTKKVLNDPDVKFEDNYAYVDDGNRTKVVYFREVDAAA